MKKILLIPALLLINSCASPEQIVAMKQQQERDDFNRCVGYGLHPGSELFANCRMQLDLERQRFYNRNYYDDYYRAPFYGSFGYYHLH
jgi:hypothetical protein